MSLISSLCFFRFVTTYVSDGFQALVCVIAPQSCADLEAYLAALGLGEERQRATPVVLILQRVAFASDAAACPGWEALLLDEGQRVRVAFGNSGHQDVV